MRSHESTESGFSWRRQAARAVMVVGALVAVSQLASIWPATQPVALDLGQSRPDVERVELTWSSDGDGEPLGGVKLGFPEGAPSVVRHTLNLPNGRYVLDVAFVHPSTSTGVEQAHRFERTVRLDGTQTRLYFGDLFP